MASAQAWEKRDLHPHHLLTPQPIHRKDARSVCTSIQQLEDSPATDQTSASNPHSAGSVLGGSPVRTGGDPICRPQGRREESPAEFYCSFALELSRICLYLACTRPGRDVHLQLVGRVLRPGRCTPKPRGDAGSVSSRIANSCVTCTNTVGLSTSDRLGELWLQLRLQ